MKIFGLMILCGLVAPLTAFYVGFELGKDEPCTLPTVPVGTLSWATSTNTH